MLYTNQAAIQSTQESLRDKETVPSGDVDEEEPLTREVWYRNPEALDFLYMYYQPEFWYWEVVDTVRRLLLTAVLSMVSSNDGVKVRYDTSPSLPPTYCSCI